MPFFSIIIPAYNIANYLPKCVESVVNQSFNDYEIIIVDDGSIDTTNKVCNELYKLYKESHRIFIIHQKNSGLGGARNTGIEKASGEFLFFLDGDDYIHPCLLEQAFEYIKKNELDIFVFDFFAVYDQNYCINKKVGKDFKILSKKDCFFTLTPSACNKIIRKDIFINNQIRFPEKKLYEDLATIPKIYPLLNNIGYLHEPLYFYLQRQNSIISNPIKKRVFELHDGFSSVVNYFKNNNFFDQFYNELEYLCVIHCSYYTLKRLEKIRISRSDLIYLKKYVKSFFPHYNRNPYLKMNNGQHKNSFDFFFSIKFCCLYLVVRSWLLRVGRIIKKRK